MAKPKVPIDFPIRYGPKTLNNPVRSPQLINARATSPFYSLTPFGSHMRSECLLRDSLNVGLVALVYYIPVIGGVSGDVIVFLGWCYLYWWLYSGGVGGVVVVVKAALRVAILILVRLLYLNVFLVDVLVVIMGVLGLYWWLRWWC